MADEPENTAPPETPPEETPPVDEPVAPPSPSRGRPRKPPAPKGLLSEEDVDRIAEKLNELNIESFREAGAFDAPLEAVTPPAQPEAPPRTSPGDVAPEGDTPAPTAPTRQTFAHRFLGIG